MMASPRRALRRRSAKAMPTALPRPWPSGPVVVSTPGELQRLRLATQVRSNLFGVVYVLDEPSAGLHPADTEALLRALDRLKHAGNSVFVVEHELDIVRHADWIVDVGPHAGEQGGEVLYSGPLPGLAKVPASLTRKYLFGKCGDTSRTPR